MMGYELPKGHARLTGARENPDAEGAKAGIWTLVYLMALTFALLMALTA